MAAWLDAHLPKVTEVYIARQGDGAATAAQRS